MYASDTLICAVCLDEILEGEKRSRAGRHTGCKHVFHWDCIKQWFRVKALERRALELAWLSFISTASQESLEGCLPSVQRTTLRSRDLRGGSSHGP
mmetsp:Transcript_77776/g.252006  ORF Transcript_77776/g.252006 Transcript_77776/m.252006 type:complete len:96 (-) Transcript_77776:1650-1937(-)